MQQASSGVTTLDDLDFASLISSKICHDVIGSVQAIALSLEVLDDQDDGESTEYAMSVIRNSTAMASAKLEFARVAFGASGSPSSAIDLGQAHKLAQGYVGSAKHRLTWNVPPGHMAKDRAKLLLNLVASALGALPQGGDIVVDVAGSVEAPQLTVRCAGPGARVPAALQLLLSAADATKVDALTIQSYYAARLARSAGMMLTVALVGSEVVFTARPAV
jgi:histidine phosphotransferase ChpT